MANKFLERRVDEWVRLVPRFKQLRQKLLKIGGVEVVPPWEPLNVMQLADVNGIVKAVEGGGQLWDGKAAKLLPMEPCGCHDNADELARSGIGRTATGWALSPDGLWRHHSWIVCDDGSLIETTVKRLLYFGC